MTVEAKLAFAFVASGLGASAVRAYYNQPTICDFARRHPLLTLYLVGHVLGALPQRADIIHLTGKRIAATGRKHHS